MREIEIKVRLDTPEQTRAVLEKRAIQLGPPKKQHDVVYGLTDSTGFLRGENWLRVRTEDDSTVYFTLKRSVTGELDSIEHEVTVSDAAELTQIIKQLGYRLYSDLTKIRRKAVYGNVEICFDDVPGLGTFMEAEKLCDNDANPVAVQAELWEFFSRLGLERSNEVTSGYDVLLRKKQGLSKW